MKTKSKMREEICRMRCVKDYMVEMVCDTFHFGLQTNEELNILKKHNITNLTLNIKITLIIK